MRLVELPIMTCDGKSCGTSIMNHQGDFVELNGARFSTPKLRSVANLSFSAPRFGEGNPLSEFLDTFDPEGRRLGKRRVDMYKGYLALGGTTTNGYGAAALYDALKK